jgi:hypothetical protein
MNPSRVAARSRSARWLGLVLMISGCGSVEYPAVTGRVTLDGEPLPDAVISFMPVDEQGVPTLGVTDSRGVYTLEQTADATGAPAGKYTVRITTYREGRPEADPPIVGAAERVPAQYNVRTTLKAEVRPGENVLDFELSSQGEIIQPPADQ